MIIWSGRGILSLLVLVVVLFGSFQLLPKESTDYAFVIAFFTSAGFSWYFGLKWNKPGKKAILDPYTGKSLRVKMNHTLFWIPMQTHGIIFSVMGIIILFQNNVLWAFIAALILTGVLLLRAKQKNNGGIARLKKARVRKETQNSALTAETEHMKAVVEEAERLARRKEKEDPRRFMPS